MIDHSSEISLAWCVLLNAMVLGSAWWFASRRITTIRSQALLDAALLGYAIQYAAVGLPGIVGQLRPETIALTAIILSATLFFFARRRSIPRLPVIHRFYEWIFPSVVAVFSAAFLLAFVQSQGSLPVISNDALTYHFPAAAQWLQHQRIDLYQTWFFNPANTYSPLAGSTFIVWLIAPFGSDVIARFVEVPALLCVGLAVYRLARQIGVASPIASLIASAAMLCRPMFLQSMMGKDDLFLAFFFITLLIALSSDRSREKFGAYRIGIALGMLLATKYTALLIAPILLLAIFDGPDWKAIGIKGFFITFLAAMLLAGPWYLRNGWLTGNPIFPLDLSVFDIHIFHGLFTAAVSDALGSAGAAASVIIGGSYGLPTPVAILLTIGWIATIILAGRLFWREPLLRTCVIGPLIGFALFGWRSPFPEVRFVVPEFLLLFAVAGYAIERFRWPSRTMLAVTPGKNSFAQIVMAVIFPVSALGTIFLFRWWKMSLPFAGIAAGAAAIAGLVFWLTRDWTSQLRAGLMGGIGGAVLAGIAYINWVAYCHNYQATLHLENAAYDQNYPAEETLWRFVDQHLPADATVAYTNLYLTYPLYGFNLQRRLVYAPTRSGVQTMADLPWLGEHLSGEKLVATATKLTVAQPDQSAWLANLKATGAQYLIVGRRGADDKPAEEAFATQNPRRFRLLSRMPLASVFAIAPWGPPNGAFSQP